MITLSTLGRANVKEATLRAQNAVDKMGRGACTHQEGLLGSLHGSKRGGVGTGVTSLVVA